MSQIICTRCNNRPASHALCNQFAEATDWDGNKVFELDFIFCNPCADVLVEEEEAEKCSICEKFDSIKVRIDGDEFKPLYLTNSLDTTGMCREHP